MRNDWSLRDIAREWTRVQEDVERHAAWILLAPLGERITPAFVGSTVPDGLDSERLLLIGWSSTEEEMARAAVSLFHGGEVHLGRLARIGSDRQMMRLERALRVFRREVDPPEWEVDPDQMRKSSAHVRVDRIAYPGLNPGHYHHSRTVLPCGEQVLTRVGPPIVEILRDLVDAVENWSACDHRECRGEFALAWSRMPKAGPLIHRALRPTGGHTRLLLRMRNGTAHEQQLAAELEEQLRFPWSSPT